LPTFFYSLKLTLTNHTSYVRALPNDDIVSGSSDQTIRIRNSADSKLKTTITGHLYDVNALTCLPNGDVVSGSTDQTIKIWNKIN
jgi:WD40 repeat protein